MIERHLKKITTLVFIVAYVLAKSSDRPNQHAIADGAPHLLVLVVLVHIMEV